jgi:hypothetical protein
MAKCHAEQLIFWLFLSGSAGSWQLANERNELKAETAFIEGWPDDIGYPFASLPTLVVFPEYFTKLAME